MDDFENKAFLAVRWSPESLQGQMWRSVMVRQGWITGTVTSQAASFLRANLTTWWLGHSLLRRCIKNAHLIAINTNFKLNFDYKGEAHSVPNIFVCLFVLPDTSVNFPPIVFPSLKSRGACHRVREFKSPARVHNCTVSVCSPAERGGGGEESS